MSDPSRYTVGSICAIATEYVTARAVLAGEHPWLDHAVGQHRAVIAVFPRSEDGTDSAAAVARDMLHTFTNIQIGLMDPESPPTLLQPAMKGLKSRHEAQGHSFSALVDEVLDKSTRLKEDYGRPGPPSDHLYRSDPLGNEEPVIHYELIASANRFVKDAQVRDILALKNERQGYAALTAAAYAKSLLRHI
ncbi:hypothetical protein BJX62DRAFT_228874 [Aspergillus germanicus]